VPVAYIAPPPEMPPGDDETPTDESPTAGSVRFGAAALQYLAATAKGGGYTVSVTKIGDMPMYELKVTDYENNVISHFGGNAEVTLPYVLKPGENPDAVIVYSFPADGTPREVPASYYENGTVIFYAAHGSPFAVGHNFVTFDDIQGHWGQKGIERAAARKLISGYGNGLFMPDNGITRAEFIQLAANAINLPAAAGYVPMMYDDIGADAWYYSAVASAGQAGLLDGLTAAGGAFSPNRAITRMEMALTLSEIIHFAKITAVTDADISVFSDLRELNELHVSAIKTAIDAGLLNPHGMGGGKFAHDEPMSRAQAALLQMNLLRALNRLD
jgi:hypothetical protein